jgi:hypothetical protein
MRQSVEGLEHALPTPREVEPPMLEILRKLELPIPTRAGCGLFLLDGELLGFESDRVAQQVNVDDAPTQARNEFGEIEQQDVHRPEESSHPFYSALPESAERLFHDCYQEHVQDTFMMTPFRFETEMEVEYNLETLLQEHQLDGFQDADDSAHQSEYLETLFQADTNVTEDNLQANSGYGNGHDPVNNQRYDVIFGYDNSQTALSDTTCTAQSDLGGFEDFFGLVAYPDGDPIFPGAGMGL